MHCFPPPTLVAVPGPEILHGNAYRASRGQYITTPSPTLVAVTGPQSLATVTGLLGGALNYYYPLPDIGNGNRAQSLLTVTELPGCSKFTTTPSPILAGSSYRTQESGNGYWTLGGQ